MRARRVQTYARRRTNLPGLADVGASPRAGDLHRRGDRGYAAALGWPRARPRPPVGPVRVRRRSCCASRPRSSSPGARARTRASSRTSSRSGNCPIAILLPPVFALVAPLIQLVLTQWRIRRIPLHRRVFAAAAVGLSYGLASVGFHADRPPRARAGVLSIRATTPTRSVAAGWSPPPECSSGRPTWLWCCLPIKASDPACGCGTCSSTGSASTTTSPSCAWPSWSRSASPSACSRSCSRCRS